MPKIGDILWISILAVLSGYYYMRMWILGLDDWCLKLNVLYKIVLNSIIMLLNV